MNNIRARSGLNVSTSSSRASPLAPGPVPLYFSSPSKRNNIRAQASNSKAVVKQVTVSQSPQSQAFLSTSQLEWAWKGVATYHILIFTGMILAAKFSPLRRFLSSPLDNLSAFIPLALIYGLLLANSYQPDLLSTIMPGSLSEGLSGGFKPQFFPELKGISSLFQRPETAASWLVHVLALNLFLGRIIFLDPLPVPTWHSLLLASFFGPLGYLSHLITKFLLGRGREQLQGRVVFTTSRGTITLMPYPSRPS